MHDIQPRISCCCASNFKGTKEKKVMSLKLIMKRVTSQRTSGMITVCNGGMNVEVWKVAVVGALSVGLLTGCLVKSQKKIYIQLLKQQQHKKNL